MVGVDKKLVNKVVYDMSKNSRHYKNAKRLDAASDRCVRPAHVSTSVSTSVSTRCGSRVRVAQAYPRDAAGCRAHEAFTVSCATCEVRMCRVGTPSSS